MATKRKKEAVKELGHLFANSQVLIFTDYRGLKVADITNLRRILREKGVEYHVTKNTLAELAANRSGMDSMIPMLDGPTAIAFVGEDIPGAAKALTDFARTSKILQIRGGLMGNKTISANQVTELTKILTKEQYIAQMMGAMRAPIQNFVNALNAPLQGFVNVLNARLDKIKAEDTSTVEAAVQVEAQAVDTVDTVDAADTGGSVGTEAADAPEAEAADEAQAETASESETAVETETVGNAETASETEMATEADATDAS